MNSDIQFHRERQVGRVVLNRPQVLNALSYPMLKALYKQLLAWKKDPSVHAVVVTSTHENVFCAGGDVRWIYEQRNQSLENRLDFFWQEYRLNELIGSFGKPYISLLNGLTMGGGVGISLHGSHPIATEQFVFAMPETLIGLFPDVGASYLLSRLPSGLGAYLGLTGARLSTGEAYKLGLVKAVIPEASMLDVIDHLIHADLSDSRAVDRCLDTVRIESKILPVMDDQKQAMIQRCFSQTTVEEILLVLKETDHPWARETETMLQHCSPISLKVTLKQLHQAATLTFHQCLQMDEHLIKHFIKGHDFYEGIRARLVDKDKTPHWQPSQLEAVSMEMIEAYFHTPRDAERSEGPPCSGRC